MGFIRKYHVIRVVDNDTPNETYDLVSSHINFEDADNVRHSLLKSKGFHDGHIHYIVSQYTPDNLKNRVA